MHPSDDLADSGLPRAVLSDESVDAAAPYDDVSAVDGLGGAEPLGYPAQLDMSGLVVSRLAGLRVSHPTPR